MRVIDNKVLDSSMAVNDPWFKGRFKGPTKEKKFHNRNDEREIGIGISENLIQFSVYANVDASIGMMVGSSSSKIQVQGDLTSQRKQIQ